jgi:hypothetical protein
MTVVQETGRAGGGRLRTRRGWRSVRLLVGASVLPIAAYAVGAWSARSGGRVRVAALLDRPVLLLGLAALLLVAALLLAPPTRGRTAFAGAAVLVGGVLVLRVLVGVLDVAVPDRTTVRVEAAPGPSDRVLLVVRHSAAPGVDVRWSVQVQTGRGWSARRWLLDVLGNGTASGPYGGCHWQGRDRLVVRAADGDHVYAVTDDAGPVRIVAP